MDESSMTNGGSVPRVLAEAEVDDLEKKIRPTILRDDGILDADARWFRVPELLHSLREARRERDHSDALNHAAVRIIKRTEAERDAARAALRDLSKRWHNFAHGEEWPDWQKCPCCADVHYALGASS